MSDLFNTKFFRIWRIVDVNDAINFNGHVERKLTIVRIPRLIATAWAARSAGTSHAAWATAHAHPHVHIHSCTHVFFATFHSSSGTTTTAGSTLWQDANLVDFDHQISTPAKRDKLMNCCLSHVQPHHHGYSFRNRKTCVAWAVALQSTSQGRCRDRFIADIDIAILCGVRFLGGTGSAHTAHAASHVLHATHSHVHVGHAFHPHSHSIATGSLAWLGNVTGICTDRLADRDLHNFMDLCLIWLFSISVKFVDDFEQLSQDPEVFLRVINLKGCG